MPSVIEFHNPFDHSIYRQTPIEEGSTVRDYMDNRLGHGKDWEYPTICNVNQTPLMRSDWGIYEIKETDLITFSVVPQGGPLTWLLVGLAVASSAAAFLIDIPDFSTTDQSDSTYYLSGQRNQTKLAEPIESSYGKNRIYPSYAARSYSKFIDNEQWAYSLYCIGQGEYEIDAHQIEDTNISNYTDIEYEIYENGDDVILFPDNIVTSSEVSGVELFGPNQTDYEGYTGPFAVNPAGTQTNSIDVDVVFPQGLYWQDDDGDINNIQVDILFEYREIDDLGNAIGSYQTLVNFSKNLRETSPQRFTETVSVPLGRYEVRAVRTNDAFLNTNEIDVAQWYQLRSQLPSTKDYGDVTLVAMKARATNNLNNQSKNRYNVIATRKLETYDGSTWTSRTATRNPIWAYCDILRSTYGGNLTDSKLAMNSLKIEADGHESRGEYFDWVFDNTTTIWDALRTTMRAVRSTPVINFTSFSVVRDQKKTLPSMVFTPDSMIKDSFQVNTQFQKPDDYDGVQIEYVDHDTYKQETVDCLFGDDAGINMEVIKLAGVTDRTRAYREGMYIRRQQIYQRESISFTTGLESNLPSYGDFIGVSHDVTQWGSSGLVRSIDGDGVTVNLSNSIDEVDGNSIAFRDKYGSIVGPITCSKVEGNDYQVVCSTAVDQTNFIFDELNDPPSYLFGQSGSEYKEIIVTEVTTNDDDTGDISGVNYDSRLFDDDSSIPPSLSSTQLIPDRSPDVPAITSIWATYLHDEYKYGDYDRTTKIRESTYLHSVVRLNWGDVIGADYYLVQVSSDGVNYSEVQLTTNTRIDLNVSVGLWNFRVAAVGNGQGPWATTSVTAGSFNMIDELGDTLITDDGDTIVIV